MDYKKEIIKSIYSLSGSRSPYDVFSDWIKCCALSIQNNCIVKKKELWKKREDEYLQTIRPYGKAGGMFGEMLGLLTLALESEVTDILGEIYMAAGLGNKNTGQFFTPFHVSKVCTQLLLIEEDGNRTIKMNEPACGAGGMVIAAAAVLKERGINYQRCLDVVAQDLDWKAVYMCYTQLSLLGIRAVVVQGDTITDPYTPETADPRRVFYTPKKMGLLI